MFLIIFNPRVQIFVFSFQRSLTREQLGSAQKPLSCQCHTRYLANYPLSPWSEEMPLLNAGSADEGEAQWEETARRGGLISRVGGKKDFIRIMCGADRPAVSCSLDWNVHRTLYFSEWGDWRPQEHLCSPDENLEVLELQPGRAQMNIFRIFWKKNELIWSWDHTNRRIYCIH